MLKTPDDYKQDLAFIHRDNPPIYGGIEKRLDLLETYVLDILEHLQKKDV